MFDALETRKASYVNLVLIPGLDIRFWIFDPFETPGDLIFYVER